MHPEFEYEIDNSKGKFLVKSLLISPIFDSDSNLKGVI